MPVLFQIVAAVIGLGFIAIILYAAMYIAEELERTSLWPLARFIKALVGGLMWAVLGVVVAAGLFGIAIVVRAIFFRPLFSFYILQFWAIRIGLVLIAFYLIWGIYHGARNRLPLSYRFQRQ